MSLSKIYLTVCCLIFTGVLIPQNRIEKEKYKGPYDKLLFFDDQLQDLGDLASRINKLKTEGFLTFFYDKNDKPATLENATFINAIKKLSEDTLLIKDYFVTGERKSAGICVPKIENLDWAKFYSYSNYREARMVGKVIYWQKYGRIKNIKFWEWSNWEKGHHSAGPIDPYLFEDWGKKYKVVNKSNLLVDELYYQEVIYDRPSKTRNQVPLTHSRNTRIAYFPELTFIFGDSSLVVTENKTKIIKTNEKMPGRTYPICNSVYNRHFIGYFGLGKINLTTMGTFCEDADINCFSLDMFNGDGLSIEGLQNTELYVGDSDGDGKDEVYLISSRDCDALIKILRIRP